ncbi:MAG: hypothetical protein JWP02_3834 [Acidimicrobiales bacterium]|jgi:hypothetical protein|nr:hypothetical protein [Acidimicrobiales bacterium]
MNVPDTEAPLLPDGHVSTVVGLRNIPETIRSVDTFDNPDYVDLFTLTTRGAREKSPEQWARTVLESTPLGQSARSLWRLLGLRLGPRHSADYVQGWRIADRGDDWMRVETASWFMTGHAVVRVDEGRVSVALFLRFDSPVAALLWLPVGVMHRRGVPAMLRQALRLTATEVGVG